MTPVPYAPRSTRNVIVRLPAEHLPAVVPPAVGHGRRTLILAVCCTSLFMVGLDNTIVNVGLPSIGASLHTHVAGLQWTMAAYTVTLASFLMFSGSIADRVGRRTIFQVGLSLFTLGSWMCSLAPSLGALIAFRVLQGIGGSMLNPSALGIITNTFTKPAERARAIGVWDGVFGLSMALGPVLGGVLVGTVGWRGIFWANIPVGLAAVSLTALFVPDSKASRARRPDPVGQVLVILMFGALAYGIIEGPAFGWFTPRIYGFFLVAVAALGILLAYEPRRAEPLIDFRFFRSVPFAASNATAVCAISAMAAFLFLTTLYLQDVRGFSALRAGLVILPMPVAMALCAPLAGRIVARRGARIPMVAAGAALTLASAALSRLSLVSSPGFLLATYALFGVGAGMVNSPITNGVMSGVPKSQAGVASGLNSASRQLGQSLGVAVVGSVLAADLHGSLHAGFLHASRDGWWIMAGCGYAVLILGLMSTSSWARETAARVMAADTIRESLTRRETRALRGAPETAHLAPAPRQATTNSGSATRQTPAAANAGPAPRQAPAAARSVPGPAPRPVPGPASRSVPGPANASPASRPAPRAGNDHGEWATDHNRVRPPAHSPHEQAGRGTAVPRPAPQETRERGRG
jgi:EmrB/QacA subfamily drug resistance transporter